MRKRSIFGITMLLLVSLMSLMPVGKAVTYYLWDNIHFVEGQSIDYPHPDRDYYGISSSITQAVDGTNLHHCQVDSVTSLDIIMTLDAFLSFIGSYIGEQIGGPYGLVVGALTGMAVSYIVKYVSETLFLDEQNCIWWWFSLVILNWLNANAYWLWYNSLTNPGYVIGVILAMLIEEGYIRVGAVTFLDAIGVGNPAPPNNPPNVPSTPSGPTSGIGCPNKCKSYTYSTSTTDPDGDKVRYQFDWGDGTTTWTGWYDSGATASASHAWYAGTYNVKVRAQDEHGAYSGWSSSKTVTMSHC